ncbi:MAG: AraC family transcriptional regulator [Oscillospiraceae bacterium]|nr:AraC family transcriptional regulator [Oscillospiraceae bacterium]
MNTTRELNYRLFVQMEEEFRRTDIKSEFSRYDDIKNGNVEKVKENFKEIKRDYYKGKGMLSEDLLRNNIYHFVIGTGIIARVCIDGGMKHDVAYTLSDIYIRRADKCRTPQEVIDLTGLMMVDFAERMNDIRRGGNVSLHVRRAVDYIYANLHSNLTLREIAEHEGIDKSYLSKLFSKEMGIPVKAYILRAKVFTAANILVFSDFPISDITNSLGFSSQSAFTSAFKKIMGTTPLAYRSEHSGKGMVIGR